MPSSTASATPAAARGVSRSVYAFMALLLDREIERIEPSTLLFQSHPQPEQQNEEQQKRKHTEIERPAHRDRQRGDDVGTGVNRAPVVDGDVDERDVRHAEERHARGQLLGAGTTV